MKQWCQRCQGFRCICQLATQADSALQWQILQHPTEAKHAKNTGRLLATSLGVRPVIGEDFSDHSALQSLVHDGTPQALLFVQHPLANNPIVDNTTHALNSLQRIWVIDATWRKALKMLLNSSLLQQLPILTVNSTTKWSVRSAPSEQHLATIEAAAAACQLLGEPQTGATLTRNFHNWQEELSRFRPD